jgi:hypothetical protein
MARADPVELELYEIECFYCGETFWICVPEYCGQRYCPEGECPKLGYAARTRERGREYQKKNGRENHAARQQALRDKAKAGEDRTPRATGAPEPKGSAEASPSGTAGPDPGSSAALPPPAGDEAVGHPNQGWVLHSFGDVTHGTTSEPWPPPGTVPPVEKPGSRGEGPHAQSGESGLDQGGESPAPAGGAAERPGLPRCFLCKHAGVVTCGFSREHPEGVRVERPPGT